jgi:uncharacterized protein YijF (DUF1287 family)
MRVSIVFSITLLSLVSCGKAGKPALTKSTLGAKVEKAALGRLETKVRYDPAYVSMKYPGGDVPADTGVCTDVVIRTLRKIDIDLQKEVHEDMRANFSNYPKNWAAKRPDRSIDHRRVPNLQTYFKRHGASLPISSKPADYHVGDLVAWDLTGRSLWHIGVVVESPEAPGSPWIVHNIGAGPVLQDCLFDWKIVGHYRLKVKS